MLQDALGGWAGIGTVTMGIVCHCTEPGWSPEIPRAGYHCFLLTQQCPGPGLAATIPLAEVAQLWLRGARAGATAAT